MVRKKDDGFIDGNVFSLFCIENENEIWYDWEAEHEPLGTIKMKAKIKSPTFSLENRARRHHPIGRFIT